MTDDGDFLGVAAAELEEPARSTLDALETLAGQLGPEHARMLQMAERGIRKVLRTGERLALIGRLDRGALEPGVTDLAALVRDVAKEAMYLEGRRTLELETQVPDAPCPVQADVEALRIGVGEAVIQAVRSAKKRVRVTLEPGQAPRVLIEDDGPGPAREAFVHPAATGDVATRSGAVVSLELAVRAMLALGAEVDTQACPGFMLTCRFAAAH